MNTNLEFFFSQIDKYKDLSSQVVIQNIPHYSKPLCRIHFGNPNGPTLFICGGIHGLERIGAQLAYSLLESFYERLSWDKVLNHLLTEIQVVFLPVANPYGYFETTRSNYNGVDLMRNAPIEAIDKTPWLLGGHKHGPHLPWFRGHQLELETKFILDSLKEIFNKSSTVISLDMHSGFGFQDQLWFPFAYTKKEFPQLKEMYSLFRLFEKSFPHHIYKIEPQSKNYLTHGDLWDYAFLNLKTENQIFIPLTLEMGSWIWVKKNPLQLFSKTGLFNPIKNHRIQRTLRRHRPLFDFLLHGLASKETWTNHSELNSSLISEKARKLYYGTNV